MLKDFKFKILKIKINSILLPEKLLILKGERLSPNKNNNNNPNNNNNNYNSNNNFNKILHLMTNNNI
jgi:hypothetical protein